MHHSGQVVGRGDQGDLSPRRVFALNPFEVLTNVLRPPDALPGGLGQEFPDRSRPLPSDVAQAIEVGTLVLAGDQLPAPLPPTR